MYCTYILCSGTAVGFSIVDVLYFMTCTVLRWELKNAKIYDLNECYCITFRTVQLYIP
jgi:hypothetical protein